MRPKDLREIGLDELAQKEREAREELFRLRMRRATGQVENRMQVRSVRRDLARILTVMGELRRKRAESSAQSAAERSERGAPTGSARRRRGAAPLAGTEARG